MAQSRQFSVRVTNGGQDFRMEVRLGDRTGRLVGELTAQCMSNISKVMLKSVSATQKYRAELQAMLIDRFEQAMRLGGRNHVLIECLQTQKAFFESVGFRVLANSNSRYQMEKHLYGS